MVALLTTASKANACSSNSEYRIEYAKHTARVVPHEIMIQAVAARNGYTVTQSTRIASNVTRQQSSTCWCSTKILIAASARPILTTKRVCSSTRRKPGDSSLSQKATDRAFEHLPLLPNLASWYMQLHDADAALTTTTSHVDKFLPGAT